MDELAKIICTQVPQNAVDYCLSFGKDYSFKFKLSSDRKTKAGDYKYLPSDSRHYISVNSGLNKYAFLITYIHEVAHLVAFDTYGRKISPHGKEWKYTFRKLMFPLLTPEIFPPDLLKIIAKHLKNPRASTHADPYLVKELQQYDSNEGLLSLNSTMYGTVFILNGKTYKRMEKRRTRIVCMQITTDRKYLVAGTTLVIPL